MTGSLVERSAIGAAFIALVAAAVGAAAFDGELELTLAMTAAVVAGLLLFDTSMGPRVDSFRPWAILSVAPALKIAPLVWLQIAADQDALVERYEHIGSLLFGACVLVAVLSLASPARSLGAFQLWYDRAAIAGAGVTAALAGASVAFLYDRGFGSERIARLIETPTWAVIGALIAACALAASYPLRPSWPLVGVLAGSAISAALLAYEVAGGSIDVGVWSFTFAAFAASTQAARPATLGARHERRRRSNVSVVVLMAAGIVAAASAIVARGDREAWSPGWMVLGVLSLWLFGQAMASRPLTEADRSVARSAATAPSETLASEQAVGAADSLLPVVPDVPPGTIPETPSRSPIASQVSLRDVRRAAAAKAAALDALAAASLERPQLRAVPDVAIEAEAGQAPAVPGDAAPLLDQVTVDDEVALVDEVGQVAAGPAAPGDADLQADDGTTPHAATTSQAPRVSEANDQQVDVARHRFLARLRLNGAEGVPGHGAEVGSAAVSANEPSPTASSSDPAAPHVIREPEREPVSASDRLPLAAHAAATSPLVEANAVSAPSTVMAHHIDPSTGLLSGAGLQQALAAAFARPVRAGDVAIMMITVRDLDHIEQAYGRLAAAAATSVIAERLRTVLPDGVVARFARSAYAVLLTKEDAADSIDVDRLARALLLLREPLRAGAFEAPIDVVAGMAHCYDGEDAASFVLRANQGLAQAVQTREPTFVSMP